jgi:hypothetical protein
MHALWRAGELPGEAGMLSALDVAACFFRCEALERHLTLFDISIKMEIWKH